LKIRNVNFIQKKNLIENHRICDWKTFLLLYLSEQDNEWFPSANNNKSLPSDSVRPARFQTRYVTQFANVVFLAVVGNSFIGFRRDIPHLPGKAFSHHECTRRTYLHWPENAASKVTSTLTGTELSESEKAFLLGHTRIVN